MIGMHTNHSMVSAINALSRFCFVGQVGWSDGLDTLNKSCYVCIHSTMPKQTRIQIAKSDIIALFGKRGRRVYRSDEIAEILQSNRANWRLTINQSLAGFIDFLVNRTALREVRFD